MEVGDQYHTPAGLLSGRIPVIHWTGGWVGPGAGWTIREVKNICPKTICGPLIIQPVT